MGYNIVQTIEMWCSELHRQPTTKMVMFALGLRLIQLIIYTKIIAVFVLRTAIIRLWVKLLNIL